MAAIEFEKGCVPKTDAVRNRYFSGKKIGVADLTLEQWYYIGKMRQMNARTVGCGVICGLSVASLRNGERLLTLNAGSGIDGCGNLLILHGESTFEFPEMLNEGEYVYLKYVDRPDQKVATGDDANCGEACEYNRIVEGMEIYVSDRLIVPEAVPICQDGPKTPCPVGAEPLLLLGRYVRTAPNRWGIDTSVRPVLHTNAELSALLCRIEKNHVSSLNGRHGDLSAVTSVNNAEPDADGHLNLQGGNNISVESDGNTLTISARSGFYAEYKIPLDKEGSHDITHNCGRYPTVDVYRRITVRSRRVVYMKKEIAKAAKDMGMTDNELMVQEEFEGVAEHMTKSKMKVSRNKKVDVALRSLGENIGYSPAVTKILGLGVGRYMEELYYKNEYEYKKIVGGSDSDPRIAVVHTDRNNVRVENLDPGDGTIHLLVIVNT